MALGDVPFGPQKNAERYITKDFLQKGASIRNGHLRYIILIKGYITKDVRGYFSKGTSLRRPLGDIFRRVHHEGPYRRTLLLIFCSKEHVGGYFSKGTSLRTLLSYPFGYFLLGADLSPWARTFWWF